LQVVWSTLPEAGALAVLEPGLFGAVELAVLGVLELLMLPSLFCTPPWPLQAPRPLFCEVVPSLQVVASTLPEAGALAVLDPAGLGAVESLLFCTPPWPLQAPRPLFCEVLPSLQVVGAASCACACGAIENAASVAATNPARIVFFIRVTPIGVSDDETLKGFELLPVGGFIFFLGSLAQG
jgi:hypothetical protein